MRKKIKILTLTGSERKELIYGFRNGASHYFRIQCRATLLKSESRSSKFVGEQMEMTAQKCQRPGKAF